MRVTIDLTDYLEDGKITNCRDCIFGRWQGYICTPDKFLCNFRCTLLDSVGAKYPRQVQSAKPKRPAFCPITRIVSK